jgi:hypothetical protein
MRWTSGDLLHDDRLAGLRGRDDEAALALADRGDDVDDPGRQVVRLVLEAEPVLRVQRGQLGELGPRSRLLGRHPVDGVEPHERVRLVRPARAALALRLALAGSAHGTGDRVAATQAGLADLRERQVHVVRAGQVAAGAHERVGVQHVEDAGDRDEDVVLRDLHLLVRQVAHAAALTATALAAVAVAVPVARAPAATAALVVVLARVLLGRLAGRALLVLLRALALAVGLLLAPLAALPAVAPGGRALGQRHVDRGRPGAAARATGAALAGDGADRVGRARGAVVRLVPGVERALDGLEAGQHVDDAPAPLGGPVGGRGGRLGRGALGAAGAAALPAGRGVGGRGAVGRRRARGRRGAPGRGGARGRARSRRGGLGGRRGVGAARVARRRAAGAARGALAAAGALGLDGVDQVALAHPGRPGHAELGRQGLELRHAHGGHGATTGGAAGGAAHGRLDGVCHEGPFPLVGDRRPRSGRAVRVRPRLGAVASVKPHGSRRSRRLAWAGSLPGSDLLSDAAPERG